MEGCRKNTNPGGYSSSYSHGQKSDKKKQRVRWDRHSPSTYSASHTTEPSQTLLSQRQKVKKSGPEEDKAWKQLNQYIKSSTQKLDNAFHDGASWKTLLERLIEEYQRLRQPHIHDKPKLARLNSALESYFNNALAGCLEQVEQDVVVYEGHRHIPLLDKVFYRCSWLLNHHCSLDLKAKVKKVITGLVDSELAYLEWREDFSDQVCWNMTISGVRRFIDFERGACKLFEFCDLPTLQRFRKRRSDLEHKKDEQKRKNAASQEKEKLPKTPLVTALEKANIAAAEKWIWESSKVSRLECRLMSDYLRVRITEDTKAMSDNCDIPGLITWLHTLYDFCCLCPESIRHLSRPRQDMALLVSGVVRKTFLNCHSSMFQRIDGKTLKVLKAFRNEDLLDQGCIELWEAMFSKKKTVSNALTPQFVFQQLNRLKGTIENENMPEAREIIQMLIAREHEIEQLPTGSYLVDRLVRSRTAIYKILFADIENHLKTVIREPYLDITKTMEPFKDKCRNTAGWEFILRNDQPENWRKTLCKVWGKMFIDQGHQTSFHQNDIDELLEFMEYVGSDNDLQCANSRRNLKIALINIFHIATTKPSLVTARTGDLLKLAQWAQKLATNDDIGDEGRDNHRLKTLTSEWRVQNQSASTKTHDKQVKTPEYPDKVPAKTAPTGSEETRAVLPFEQILLPQESAVSAPFAFQDAPLFVVLIPTTTTLVQVPCAHMEPDKSIKLTLQPVLLHHTTYEFDWMTAINNRTLVNVVNGLNQVKAAMGAFPENNPTVPEAPKLDTKTIRPVRDGMYILFRGLDMYMTPNEREYFLGRGLAFPVTALKHAHWQTLFRIADNELAKGNMTVSMVVRYACNYLIALHVHQGFLTPQPQYAIES